MCEALEEVNLDPAIVLNKLPAELSGGMRKRVGLARAIVGQPEILLYDEPVTGLDPVNTAAIEHLITEIGERTRVTSIVVTHDIEGAGDLRPGGAARPRQAALRRHADEFRAQRRPAGARLRRPGGGGRPRQLVEREDRTRRTRRSREHRQAASAAPRGRDREVWVGLFVIVGDRDDRHRSFVLTDAAMFRGRYIVTTTSPNAGGIRKGDPVQMRGVNIGRILGFPIAQRGVSIRLEIEGEYQIPADSHVELKSSGLLGRHGGGRDARASSTQLATRRRHAAGRHGRRHLRQDGQARGRVRQGRQARADAALGRDGEGHAGQRVGRTASRSRACSRS